MATKTKDAAHNAVCPCNGEPCCPKCGCYDLAPVDGIPGGKITVACNGCDHYFEIPRRVGG